MSLVWPIFVFTVLFILAHEVSKLTQFKIFILDNLFCKIVQKHKINKQLKEEELVKLSLEKENKIIENARLTDLQASEFRTHARFLK